MKELLVIGAIVFPILIGLISLVKTKQLERMLSDTIIGMLIWMGFELLLGAGWEEAAEVVWEHKELVYTMSGCMLVYFGVNALSLGWFGTKVERKVRREEHTYQKAWGIREPSLWCVSVLFYVPVLIRVMDSSALPPPVEERIKVLRSSWLAWPIAFLTYMSVFGAFVYGLFFKNWSG